MRCLRRSSATDLQSFSAGSSWECRPVHDKNSGNAQVAGQAVCFQVPDRLLQQTVGTLSPCQPLPFDCGSCCILSSMLEPITTQLVTMQAFMHFERHSPKGAQKEKSGAEQNILPYQGY